MNDSQQDGTSPEESSECGERERKGVCVCVCEREREREINIPQKVPQAGGIPVRYAKRVSHVPTAAHISPRSRHLAQPRSRIAQEHVHATRLVVTGCLC